MGSKQSVSPDCNLNYEDELMLLWFFRRKDDGAK